MNQYSLLSFNVLRDLRDDPAWAWPVRRPLVLHVIKSAAPDVIAFQEVAPDMRRDLADALPDYAWAPRERTEAHGRPLYVGDVAYRRDRFTLEQSELHICEPGTAGDDGWPVERWPAIYGGVWARLRDSDDARLAVWSVHLPHQSEPLRLHFAHHTADWLAQQPRDTHAIIAGDFNARPGSASHQAMQQHGFQDAYDQARQRTTVGERTYPDWIMLHSQLTPTHFKEIDHREDDTRASDHIALQLLLQQQ